MLTVRLSPGADPVLDIQASSLAELDVTLRELRAQGVWSALKGAAREFADAPLAGVESVEAALPGAQIISGAATSAETETPEGLAPVIDIQQWNDSAAERAIERGKIERPVVQQQTPKCHKCGQATTFGSGTGATGTQWSAYFCASGNREHTRFL